MTLPAKLDPIDPAAAPASPNTAKVVRIYVAQRFAPVRCVTQLPADLGSATTPRVIQCRATGAGSDAAVFTITDEQVDLDVYDVTEEAAFLLAGQVLADLRHNAPGVTLDRSTITRVLTIASPAVRPYINTNVVRVGATLAVGLHTRSR